MNCKQGELAFLVKPTNPINQDRVVRCLRLATSEEIKKNRYRDDLGPVWVTDTLLPMNIGRFTTLVHDSAMRPIRFQDGQDETLSWKPVPTPVEGA